jgi:thiol-disulfide isomerase/thioredoxin
MRPSRLLRLALVTAFSVWGVTVVAQETDEPNPIKWSIKSRPGSSDNKTFIVELRAHIDAGWHLYSTEKIEGGPSPTRITLLAGQNLELAGEIDSPAPRSAYDPNFQVATEYYEGDVTFAVPVRSTSPATRVRLQVRYQTCTPTLCLPPKLLELEAALTGEETKSQSATNTNTRAAYPLATADTAVDFDFTDFNGKPRHLSEFRGKVVLLDFWASWCSPCLADIPQLKAAYAKYQSRGFEIIGLDSETLGQKDSDAEFAKESQMKAREIVTTRGVGWIQSIAQTSVPVATATFGVENLPAKILLDRRGKVIGRLKSVAELDELLPKLLTTPD